jgi:hypothetical protein
VTKGRRAGGVGRQRRDRKSRKRRFIVPQHRDAQALLATAGFRCPRRRVTHPFPRSLSHLPWRRVSR